MSDNKEDAVKNKMGRRFDDDEGMGEGQQQENSKKEKSSNGSKQVKRDKKGQKSKSVNIKSEWKNHSFYLETALAEDLSSEYKRLDWEFDDFDQDIMKTRHYYPLIVRLGLEKLEDLEAKEVKERVAALDAD
jgi:hypothetical protein